MKQSSLAFRPEKVADNFCGGGGASTGIRMALGRDPDFAINHDPVAIAMHIANHPDSVHFCQDVFRFDPNKITEPVGLAWFSPDCKHFSKAKGGKPVTKKIRDLAWVVVRWAETVKPRVILLENVEEFQDWGPLLKNAAGKWYPDPLKKGLTFRRWVRELQRAGYVCDWKQLRACDYGAPTIRKRFFFCARRDGLPIVWPKPTHAAPTDARVKRKQMKPFRTAAECIDWTLPCPSIFLTAEEGKALNCKRPLAPATMRRIHAGMHRFVLDSADPFIVPIEHYYDGENPRAYPLDEPLRTVNASQTGSTFAVVTPFVTKFRTGSIGASLQDPLPTITAGPAENPAGAPHALGIIAPTLIQTGYGERPGQRPRWLDLHSPIGTFVDGQKHALVAAFLAQHNTERNGNVKAGRPVDAPISTVVGSGSHQQLVASTLLKLKGTCKDGQDLRDPLHTVQAGGNHYAQVQAFLMQYYSDGGAQARSLNEPMPTVTANDRIAIVTIHGVDYAIVDIGMRMLQPHELFAAQGFPPGYVIDPMVTINQRGKPVTRRATKNEQVRCAGNSVCPPLAAALVRANFKHEERFMERTA